MIWLSNNGGDTFEDAIVIIGAKFEDRGTAAEYQYIEKRFGRRGRDWELYQQHLHYESEGKRIYDELQIFLPHGGQKSIYFDITDFYGKLKENSPFYKLNRSTTAKIIVLSLLGYLLKLIN